MTPNRLWTLFLLLLVLLPLPLGGFRPWAWSAAGLATASLILFWVRDTARSTTEGNIVWRPLLWPPFALFLIAILWILIQQSGVIALNPLWGMASDALGAPLDGAISLAPQAGLAGLIRLLSFAGCFWIALQYGRDRDRAYRLIRWFVMASGLYAFYGLANYIAGNERLLWFPRLSYPDDVTGTFVNRNSYATYAGLGLLASIAMFMQLFRQQSRLVDPTLSWLGRFFETIKGEPAFYGTVAIVVAMAWLQSHSRMGFFAGVTGLVALVLVGRTIRTMRGRAIGVVLAAIAIAIIMHASGSILLDRVQGTTRIDRLPIFALAAKAVETAPLTGHGFGGFGSVLPMFRDASLPDPHSFAFAHDTYLELAVEIGLPAAIAMTVAVLWLAVLCAIGAYTRNRDNVIPSLAFAAAVLVGVHALLDFSVQMTAIGCILAALLGIGNAQAWHAPARARIG